jgi:hypothetical protein
MTTRTVSSDYDAVGNRQQVTEDSGLGTQDTSYSYDARNRCVKRVVNGVTTYLLDDRWSLIEERDAELYQRLGGTANCSTM